MSSSTGGPARLGAYCVMALCIWAAAHVFDNKDIQQPRLTGPYHSGAANYEWGRGWRYSEADVVAFASLGSVEAHQAHRFSPSEDLRSNDLSTKGYLFVSLVARNLFFWQGDMDATESLQVLTHIILTLCLVSCLRSRLSKLLIFLLFGLNPLLLRYATYPYYYYWQTVPTALLAAYLLNPALRLRRLAIPAALSLAAMYVIRPTVVAASVFFFALLGFRESKPMGVICIAIFLACGMWLFGGNESRKDPWHTAYTSIGGYPNPYVATLNDTVAYEMYERETGEKIVQDGNYFDPELRGRLSEVTRKAYMDILQEAPLMLVRNAALNFFESFSLGYVTRSLGATYASAVFGLCFFCVLVIRRKFLFVVAIALSSATFVPYGVPVPVYMFGSYVLIFAGMIALAEDLPRYEEWSNSPALRWIPF